MMFSMFSQILSPTWYTGAWVLFRFAAFSYASCADTIVASANSLTSFSFHRIQSALDTWDSQLLSGGMSDWKTSWFQPCVIKKGAMPVDAAFHPHIALTLT